MRRMSRQSRVPRLARFVAPLILTLTAALALPACSTTPSPQVQRSEPVGSPADRHAPAVPGVAVATVHPLATRAALDAFDAGGNAVDAAVAAALTLGVVDSHNSGLGGGCFILIATPDGQLLAIDGRETAPSRATPDMYRNEAGDIDPDLSQTGPLAVGTPGALAAYQLALQRTGQLKLPDVIRPAARLAAAGFPIDDTLADRIERTADDLRKFPGAAAIFLNDDGSPKRAGDTLKQPDLAATYHAIADQGPDWFYRGEFAQAVDAWMQQHGGRLRADDFAAYESLVRQPVVSTYRGYKIVGYPPPSSGGVHVAQILNILERFDLAALHEQSESDFVHVVAEAMKLAFADRAHWLGDPAFAPVPVGLIDKAYAQQLADRIRLDRATPVDSHAQPPRWNQDHFGRHTTHIAAADSHGYVVAITATINTSFGSKVVVPGTGVVLNNEMDDFALAPGVPNAFGLVGAAANKVEPGKRPLSSMSPTIVFHPDGSPALTVGAAGGPRIITQALLTTLRTLDLGQPLAPAVAVPRFHHQWKPDVLYLERPLFDRVAAELRGRGHTVEPLDYAGITQAIRFHADKSMTPIADPRVQGSAAVR